MVHQKTLFSFTLLLALPLTALAADGPWYIGADIGVSTLDQYSQSVSAGITRSNGSINQGTFTITDNEDDDQGFKLTIGHQFTENWGLEFSYLALGDFSSGSLTRQELGTPAISTFPGFANVPAVIEVNQSFEREIDGLNLNLVGRWPLPGRLFLVARAGIFSYDAKISQTISQEVTAAVGGPEGGFFQVVPQGPSSLESEKGGNEVTYGLGLNYRVSDSVDLELEYQFYKDIASTDIETITAGFSYRF